MTDGPPTDGLKIRFISGLPRVTGFSGTRHHNPLAPPGSPSGAAGEIALAHLTGTSAGIDEAAAGLHAKSVPFVYSPMLRAAVAPGRRWLAPFTAAGRSALEQLSLAGRIALLASRVAAENSFMAGYLAGEAGIDPGKIVAIGTPAIGTGTVAAARPEADGGGCGNLLVACCDELTPEWNVMRLLSALEKINADAVIVTARADGAYARECAERAGLNPRVKFILADPDRGDTDHHHDVAAALTSASIVVDPSTDGLCYAFIAAAAVAGIPAVISRRSACGMSMPGEVSLFEPSSWELLNHAVTTAFNRSVQPGKPGGGAPVSGASGTVAPEKSRASIASAFRKLYGEVASWGPRGGASFIAGGRGPAF